MKKYILKLAALSVMALAACTQQPSESTVHVATATAKAIDELTAAARTICKECPIRTDDNMLLEGATFSNNQWTYHYVVREDSVVDFNLADKNSSIREGLKQSTQRHILESKEMLTMMRALVNANADLVYDYRGSKSGKNITVRFTFTDIRVMTDAMTNYYNPKHIEAEGQQQSDPQ